MSSLHDDLTWKFQNLQNSADFDHRSCHYSPVQHNKLKSLRKFQWQNTQQHLNLHFTWAAGDPERIARFGPCTKSESHHFLQPMIMREAQPAAACCHTRKVNSVSVTVFSPWALKRRTVTTVRRSSSTTRISSMMWSRVTKSVCTTTIKTWTQD